jgi:catechol 2,3-dioxygenase-like lactoylglutathione lyase family enzyme
VGLALAMVGVIVEDMAKSVEFYRRLGVDVPEGSEEKHFVAIKMGELTFFLSDKPITERWDPARTEADQPAGAYKIVLEFYLKTRAAVDQKYAEMVGFGYDSHAAPYDTPYNNHFALIYDPDGNTVLLSGEV